MRKAILRFGGLSAVIALLLAIYWHVEAGNRKGEIDVVYDRRYAECKASSKNDCPREPMRSNYSSWPVYRNAIEYRNISLAVAPAAIGASWVLILIAGGLSRARKAGLHKKAGNAVGESLAASVQHTANAMDKAKGRTRECPLCAEWIKPNASICPHCRSEIGSG